MNAEQIVVKRDEQATMRVSVNDRKVVQHFPHALEWLALEAEEAIRLGYVLIERGWEAKPELKPLDNNAKHELIERHRRTLTQRAAVMLNSTREKKTLSNRSLARLLVEAMLKEVFT